MLLESLNTSLIDFQINADFPSQFCVFYRKITYSATQRSVSQENAFKKSKNPSPFFFRKTIGK